MASGCSSTFYRRPRHALAELIEGKSEVLTLVEERAEEIDFAEIEQRAAGRTSEMLALRQARRGQGKYRDDLLNLWGKACAVTGCDLESVLRASHALPRRRAAHRSADFGDAVGDIGGLVRSIGGGRA